MAQTRHDSTAAWQLKASPTAASPRRAGVLLPGAVLALGTPLSPPSTPRDRSALVADDRTRLPSAYVAEHVDLGYALTTHRAQSLTTDTAHPVLAPVPPAKRPTSA